MPAPARKLTVTLNGTGFAADYTARCYGLLPHKNGVTIDLAGVTSGRLERAEAFRKQYGVGRAFASHEEMVRSLRPDIDNVCCANYAHGQYVIESARAGPLVDAARAGAGQPQLAHVEQALMAVGPADRELARAGLADLGRRVRGLHRRAQT